MRKILAVFVVALATGSASAGTRYEANWASLDKRPVPRWWTDAKFGIFVHWGPYAVPAYAPIDSNNVYACYSEWYHGRYLLGQTAFVEHHARHYANAPYGNFAAQFRAENFDAKAWADLFRRAGAKYAVLTSKHHDGYALWPSPESPYYNAVVLGSGRDLAGEFTVAMKDAGLKSGFYFSLLEYANPLYPRNFLKRTDVTPLTVPEWARRVNLPQMKELVERYGADIIWPDGEWDYSAQDHLSEEFLAWLYNDSRMRETVVVNDRWGKGVRGHHGGHYTTEYALEGGDKSGLSEMHPWEECRGIGSSFGYNRFENAEAYMSREKCIETLVAIVSAGGNLLLNVGPTADGRIPPIMEDRLLAIGAWLKVNGEAIYASTRGPAAVKGLQKQHIYFTQKPGAIYMIVFGNPGARVSVPGLGEVRSVSLLGSSARVAWKSSGSDLTVDMPSFRPGESPCEHALVFKIAL